MPLVRAVVLLLVIWGFMYLASTGGEWLQSRSPSSGTLARQEHRRTKAKRKAELYPHGAPMSLLEKVGTGLVCVLAALIFLLWLSGSFGSDTPLCYDWATMTDYC